VQPCKHDFEQALQSLKQGGIVAYPTETFYGLAVDPENDQAIASLYALKQRGKRKPLSLLIPDLEQLFTIASSCPEAYPKLIDTFWPGPLTLIFPAKKHISSVLTGGGTTVAMRISSHPVAMELCEAWGRALTATSANVSGEPALVTAKDVYDLWGDQISFILDGGTTPGGKGSTIIQCFDKEKECRIIREGVIDELGISQNVPPHYIICKS
jgi:L-threonylcarbamoyladenylate synthase